MNGVLQQLSTRSYCSRIQIADQRARIVPPEGHGDAWTGAPQQDHIAYPPRGEHCRCGNCSQPITTIPTPEGD